MIALQIIESAYRCTIEEQDDPAIWIAHAMNKARAELGVLLQGNAVNYAIREQDASGLTFGDISHSHPPAINQEISRFIDNSITVYMIKEDADLRGISDSELIPGLEIISRDELPTIFSKYDQIWHW